MAPPLTNAHGRASARSSTATLAQRLAALKDWKHLQGTVDFWRRVGMSFWENRCQVRASALAYTTLIALVPLLAVSLSVASLVFDARSEESEGKLADYIDQAVMNIAPALGLNDSGGEAQRAKVARQILKFTRNIHFGTIGVTSMAGLMFVAISLLRTIEAAFNDIWGVTRARGWFQSVVIYWAAITLGPIILVVATTSGYVSVLYARSDWLKSIPGAALFQTSILPIAFVAFALAGFYMVMPNTRVPWRAALAGGAIAAVLWLGNHWLGALYNTKVVMYSKIYGSIGAVPIFLAGLYVSWTILLFGAQTAYVCQHWEAYREDLAAVRLDQHERERAALWLMAEIGRRFKSGEPRATPDALANRLGYPPRVILQILNRLADVNLLAHADPGGNTFTPARPLNRVYIADILHALRAMEPAEAGRSRDPAQRVIRAEHDLVVAAERQRSAAVTLEDLVERVSQAGTTS